MKLNLIKHVVAELAEQIGGSRVSKIHQPAPEVLLFKLWNGKDTLRLLLSAEAHKCRLHLTDRTWPNPHIPPRFCQLLRARISRISTVSVINDDRIVQFECIGKHGDCCLLLEMIGNRSNLILVDDRGTIIDVLKRIPGTENHRAMLPGEKYIFPQQQNSTIACDQQLLLNDVPENSWNGYVEKLYSGDEHAENKGAFCRQLQQTISRQIKKLQKRLLGIEKDLQNQKNADNERQIGELLLANLHIIKPGMNSIELQNYYSQTPEFIVVDLDPLLKPQQNAEKYFNKYKKARRGQEHSQRRLQETQTELEWLDQLDYILMDNVKNADMEEIADELRQAGLLKEKNRLHSKRTLQPSRPHEATSPSGFKIIWGRNNRQNDAVSTKLLKKGDFWFHVHQIPGAHVVLRATQGESPLDEDLLYAAAIAGGYSKARDDAKVEVMQADAKSVHKPKGARAGLVNVSKYKTLLVKPLRFD